MPTELLEDTIGDIGGRIQIASKLLDDLRGLVAELKALEAAERTSSGSWKSLHVKLDHIFGSAHRKRESSKHAVWGADITLAEGALYQDQRSKLESGFNRALRCEIEEKEEERKKLEADWLAAEKQRAEALEREAKIKEQKDFEESEHLAQQMWGPIEGLREKMHASDVDARRGAEQDLGELQRLSADLLKKPAANKRSSMVSEAQAAAVAAVRDYAELAERLNRAKLWLRV